jgi:streptogramin lyase
MGKFAGLLAQAILVGLLSIPALAASPRQVDRTSIIWAQQDSTGVVWGVAAFGTSGLYRWEQNAWHRVAGGGTPEGGLPIALVRGLDGAVYCLWNNPSETHTLTRHQGDASRQFARFTGALAGNPNPSIFADPKGNFWITEWGTHIYRITPEGKAESAYTIPGDEFVSQSCPVTEPGNFRLVLATADGVGRVWFWSESPAPCTNLAVLRGVLIFDGEKFQHHPQLNGIQNAMISVVEPADAQHMWVAAPNDQLYRVDIDTLEAKPMTPPEPQAFQSVQKIFCIDNDTFVISGLPMLAVPEANGGGRSGMLWRLTDGKWKKGVNGLDSDLSTYFSRKMREWVSTQDGLWVGTYGSGPWFIPARGGEAKLVDWHCGYPLNGSERMFQLPDGRLLTLALYQGSTTLEPADLRVACQSPPEVETINPYRELVQDARGHLLGIVTAEDNALSDWDGEKWAKYSLPAAFAADPMLVTTTDSLGRTWILSSPVDFRGRTLLLSSPLETAVAIFDPKRGSFETFPNYPDALQSQLPLQEDLQLNARFFLVPSFTKDGRICYRDLPNRVRYFDGGRWRNWLANEIAGPNMLALDGPPFFDRAGNLAVHLQGSTWEFTEQRGWQHIGQEVGLGTDQEMRNPRPVSMPLGCVVEHPDSVVTDRLGTYWFTSHGRLYRAIEGLCSPQFAPDEHQPFIDSRKLMHAMIDPKGNAFLATEFAPNQIEYVFLKARQPLPQTVLRASADASGTITLHFSTNTKGAPSFTWRMDGGPWSAPTKSTETMVEGALGGKHRIEAAAVDERLQIAPMPTAVVIDIQAATEEQITALIQKLSDPDYALRDKAVAALVRQSDAALPLLRSAREKAAPDQRWWIDAAIQQIEESLSTNKKL